MTTVVHKTRVKVDSGEPLDIAKEYAPKDLIAHTFPAIGGPWVSADGLTYQPNDKAFLKPVATIAANTLTDPLSIANVLLFNNFVASLGSEIIELTPAEMIQKAGDAEYDADKFGIVNVKGLDTWGLSRRMRRVFNHPGPGDFDFIGLGYPDKTAIFVRNVSSANGIDIVYGTGGANTLEITHANGITQTIAAQDAVNIQPSEIAVVEKDGTNVYVSVFPGERVSYFESYAAANAAPPTPHDGIVVIRDKGEIFGRKTNFNSRVFPADGKPNVDFFKVGDTHTHEILENIAVHVSSAGTNAGSSVDIELLVDGAWNPTDWVVSTAPVTGLEATTAHPALHLDRVSVTGPIGIGHNKNGWLFFEYIGDATEGDLTGVNYTGANGAASDGEIIVNFAGTNDNVSFTDKASVTATHWTVGVDPVGLPVEQRANNESSVVGKTNLRYQDDTKGAVPAVVLGQEYADSTVPVNRGDTPGPGIEATSIVYLGADIGNGPEWVVVQGGQSDIPIVRYTADGLIEDKDHRAIFETGANNMTLPVSTQDRLIQIISEGPATIITADGTEQFTGPAGTSTDSILNVNETFQWATILGRGAAAGWSQYVGLVATAQSVGAMVDFSESPGPGDAGSFSLALTNSGANLRYILTLTCSNGTNFSPPLDTDDGTNRWWYDFDHTTGVVNIRRFGAFAGGSVRGVALYS